MLSTETEICLLFVIVTTNLWKNTTRPLSSCGRAWVWVINFLYPLYFLYTQSKYIYIYIHPYRLVVQVATKGPLPHWIIYLLLLLLAISFVLDIRPPIKLSLSNPWSYRRLFNGEYSKRDKILVSAIQVEFEGGGFILLFHLRILVNSSQLVVVVVVVVASIKKGSLIRFQTACLLFLFASIQILLGEFQTLLGYRNSWITPNQRSRQPTLLLCINGRNWVFVELCHQVESV